MGNDEDARFGEGIGTGKRARPTILELNGDRLVLALHEEPVCMLGACGANELEGAHVPDELHVCGIFPSTALESLCVAIEDVVAGRGYAVCCMGWSGGSSHFREMGALA